MLFCTTRTVSIEWFEICVCKSVSSVSLHTRGLVPLPSVSPLCENQAVMAVYSLRNVNCLGRGSAWPWASGGKCTLSHLVQSHRAETGQSDNSPHIARPAQKWMTENHCRPVEHAGRPVYISHILFEQIANKLWLFLVLKYLTLCIGDKWINSFHRPAE